MALIKENKNTPEELIELIECNLCLGFWIYLIWSALLQINVLDGLVYIPVLSEIVSAMFISLIMWLAEIGWNAEFRIIQVDVNAER